MRANWTQAEVEAAVTDYFEMLRLELSGQKYNKSAHRHKLRENLDSRSDGSVELKHQNISAVLIEMGVPYIDGYKPRYNYQRTVLPEVVTEYLEKHPDFQKLFNSDVAVVPAIPSVGDILSIMENPPDKEERIPRKVAESRAIYNPRGINYLESEAKNQALGDAGEEFVINFERARLIHAGKETLADKIEQISVTEGPSAGFDIRSFESNGTDRFIEAKTTKYGKNTPFYVTPNELVFSKENQQRYYLFRVFKFRDKPRIFTLRGDLAKQCSLQPTSYLAKVG